MTLGLTLIIFCYLAGLVLILTELVMPGLIIGIIGAVFMGTSLYFGFAEYGLVFGLAQIGIAIIIIPLALLTGLKRLTLKKELKTSEGFIIKETDRTEFLNAEGTALTDLRPAGLAMVNNQKIDVVTEGDFINKNSRIKIIEIQGNRVVVRAI